MSEIMHCHHINTKTKMVIDGKRILFKECCADCGKVVDKRYNWLSWIMSKRV